MAAELHVKLSLHINFKPSKSYILRGTELTLKVSKGMLLIIRCHSGFPSFIFILMERSRLPIPLIPPDRGEELWYRSKKIIKALFRGQCKGCVEAIEILFLIPRLLFTLLDMISKDKVEPRDRGGIQEGLAQLSIGWFRASAWSSLPKTGETI